MKQLEGRGRSVRVALFLFLLLTISVAVASCKRTSVENAANSNAASAADDTSATPPYQTKEPERYQATVVTTGSLGGQGAPAGGQPGVSNQQVFMARDGEKRRMEFELLPGAKMTFLQLAEGSYILYPAKKLYAEVKSNEGNSQAGNQGGTPPDFSADKLLNQSRTGARYEKLGTEEVGGRQTTKYRVTAKTGEAKDVTTETIVWVDESLGMPIRSETTSTSGSKFTMEIKDIKLEVDPSLFNVPKDYRKVSREDIQKEALAKIPGLLGSDGEEKKEEARKALYQRFMDNFRANQKAAYDTAREYLRKYPEESDETKYLTKWIEAYEAKEGKKKQ